MLTSKLEILHQLSNTVFTWIQTCRWVRFLICIIIWNDQFLNMFQILFSLANFVAEISPKERTGTDTFAHSIKNSSKNINACFVRWCAIAWTVWKCTQIANTEVFRFYRSNGLVSFWKLLHHDLFERSICLSSIFRKSKENWRTQRQHGRYR